ncbi:hypothetical protein UlMin_000762 [Ulmus minor]
MNHFSLQQNAFMGGDEMRVSSLVSDPKDPVVCPKPRRVGTLSNNAPRPLRLHISSQSELCDSKAGADLLDLILMKYNGAEQSMTQLASSPPPFFCGSPLSRAANPLTQDARFKDEKVASFQAFPFPPPSSFTSPSSSTRKGGCVRMNFGLKPTAVRVEGFDCLNRDCQNSSIPAMA